MSFSTHLPELLTKYITFVFKEIKVNIWYKSSDPLSLWNSCDSNKSQLAPPFPGCHASIDLQGTTCFPNAGVMDSSM